MQNGRSKQRKEITEKKRIILPDGEPADDSDDASQMTARGLEREREDEQFTQVILKRSDEAVRHPDDTLEKVIEVRS